MVEYKNEKLPKEQRLGQVGVNNQGLKMTIIAYRNSEDIDIQFENGAIVKNRVYGNFIKGKVKYIYSFAQWGIDTFGEDFLEKYWSSKNTVNPWEISYQSNKKVWLYCQEHDYHNYDREGNKIGYETKYDNFIKGHRCSYCGNTKVHYKDSLGYLYPNIAKMIIIPKNKITIEDTLGIACRSKKKFYFKCLDCGAISDKKKSLFQIIKKGNSCKYCSDGISIPEKFMINTLKQLNINFQTQLSKSNFNWCKNYRYDFYIPKYNMIIEVHGGQHYKEQKESAIFKKLEEEQANDKYKKYLAKKNGIKRYYSIDCRYSELEYMKDNIIKTLGHLFDLSNINWELIWQQCQNSLCIKSWELWNNGLHSPTRIGEILNLNRNTITRYLKRGTECKKCDYKS